MSWTVIACAWVALLQDPTPAPPGTIGPPAAASSGPGANGDGLPVPRAARTCPAAEQAADAAPPLTQFEGTPVERVAKDHPGGAPRVRRYIERDPQGHDIDHGPDRRWFANRQLELERVWRHGRADGPFVEYYENGFEKTRGNFVADDKDGEWLTWHEEGGLAKLQETWKHGRLDGVRREWFRTGVQRLHAAWKDGVQDGPYRVWYGNGSPCVDGHFVAGKRDGEWKEWMEDGTLEMEGRFVAGLEEGAWKRVQRVSLERYVESYLHGQLDGPRASFDASGKKPRARSLARATRILRTLTAAPRTTPATLAGRACTSSGRIPGARRARLEHGRERAERLAINGTQQITARLFAGASSLRRRRRSSRAR